MARETFPNNSFTDVVLHYDSELKKQLYEYPLHIQCAHALRGIRRIFILGKPALGHLCQCQYNALHTSAGARGGRPSGLQWMLSTAQRNADSVLAHQYVYLYIYAERERKK